MDKKDSILNNPERYVLVRNKEQILQLYGDIFEECTIDILPFYIERVNSNTSSIFRFIITPSGVVAVASEDKEYIWGIDFDSEEGISLLEQLNVSCAQIKSSDIHDLIPTLETETQKYYLRIFPYNDQRASEVLVYELENKFLASKLE